MSGFKSDHQLVRDYVTAMDHLQYTQLPEDVVAITMTHSNLATKHVDLRFNLHQTIGDVKERFRVHIGTPPEYQQLFLRDNGNTICELRDNSKMLGFYSPKSGMEIHVVDHDPHSLSRNGGLTDVSLVQKYTISEESYNKRQGTVREFIRNKRKDDPNYKLRPAAGPGSESAGESAERAAPPGAESVEGVTVGARCEVMPGSRRGTVRFVGEIPEISAGGHWVGVEFDEPMGHNDGAVKGRVIFECGAGYGAFVRGKNVTVGDFPVRDLFDELDEENEENNAEKPCNASATAGCEDSACCKPAPATAVEEDEDEI